MLDRHGVPWSAIDQDAAVVARGRRSGCSLYFGDASRPGFLERCGLESARALVITTDSNDGGAGSVEALVALVRERSPDRAIFARGALQAASWLSGRAPGRYRMVDVLGLKTRT